jgi:hypothetical protein
MSLYALILFSHVAGALFLFAGLALEWTALHFLRREVDRHEAGPWIQLAAFAPRLYGPALGLILLSGGYLTAQISGWSQGWTRVSFPTLILIGLLGVALTSPRLRAIRKVSREDLPNLSTVLRTRLHDPILIISLRVRMALVFGVVLLMVSKVDINLSLFTIACAFALGLLISVPAWFRSPRPQVSNSR